MIVAADHSFHARVLYAVIQAKDFLWVISFAFGNASETLSADKIRIQSVPKFMGYFATQKDLGSLPCYVKKWHADEILSFSRVSYDVPIVICRFCGNLATAESFKLRIGIDLYHSIRMARKIFKTAQGLFYLLRRRFFCPLSDFF